MTFLTSFVVLGAGAATAAASNSVAVAVSGDSATITSNGGPGGNCAWLVDATVTVVNLSSTNTVSVSKENGPNGRVSWSDNSSNSGVVTPDVSMTWPGSSDGYGVVGPSSSLETTAVATFTIPCSATNGDLGIDFHVYQGVYPDLGQETTLSGDASFLTDGTPVPVYAGIAGLLFAGLLGGVLFVRAHRRPGLPVR